MGVLTHPGGRACLPARLHPMRSLVVLLLALLLAGTAAAAGHDASAARLMSTLRSASVAVYSMTDGEVASRAAGTRRSVASITKLMTAMVVLDDGKPLEAVLDLSSADADTIKRTRSRLPRGAGTRREELLLAALMSSDNTAALALARHSEGGRAAFVQRMNAKAAALGMARTTFVDPAGLSPGNVSSASDVARLVEAAARYDFIRQATTQSNAQIRGVSMRNTNPWVSDAAWGFAVSKTGYTTEAGRCIAVVLELGHHRYAVVLLGAPTPRARAKDLAQVRRWLGARHAVGEAAAPSSVQLLATDDEDTGPAVAIPTDEEDFIPVTADD